MAWKTFPHPVCHLPGLGLRMLSLWLNGLWLCSAVLLLQLPTPLRAGEAKHSGSRPRRPQKAYGPCSGRHHCHRYAHQCPCDRPRSVGLRHSRLTLSTHSQKADPRLCGISHCTWSHSKRRTLSARLPESQEPTHPTLTGHPLFVCVLPLLPVAFQNKNE